MGQLADDIYQTATKEDYNVYGLLKAVWSAKGYPRRTKKGQKTDQHLFSCLNF